MNESQRVSDLSKRRQRDENIPNEKRNENYDNTNENQRVSDCPDNDKGMKPFQVRMEITFKKMIILKIISLPGETLPCPEYQKKMKGRK